MSFLDNFFISVLNKTCMILSFSRIFFYFYTSLLLYFPKINLFLGPCEPKLAVKKVPKFFQQFYYLVHMGHTQSETDHYVISSNGMAGRTLLHVLHVQNRILNRITKFFWWILHPISFISVQSNWNLFLVVVLNSLLGDFGMK